ncbi:SusC/RagA family TonB-linked outer membrane protein [Chryseobacterium pennae]|uniref:SusC/RagA family TonB-linked outer membrane protein n=1 Tax=Chryseobacterium pennae TaxID=2258962 RepID=A0A3D9C9N2_9FLAO|nr:SusC/RagA family TonB-linked outer membrane protein [Chryseobacterium pennae]REC62286.1 SusC/RagA family TonB-linked outer membrane protein [Chryseobacterium pennae]
MKKHDFSNKENIPPWVDGFSHRRKLLRIGIKSTLFFMLLASGTAIKAQQISLSLQKAPLSKAISEIRKATKYDFAYKEELLKKVGPITVNLKNASIEETLRTLFANQPIAYEIADGIIILSERKTTNTPNSKKKETIKGKIVDEKGNPLAGATITIKGSNYVTNSDNDGTFELPSNYAESEIQISFLGYSTMTVSAKYIDRVTLTTNSNVIDEVSVVASGYQSIPKERATGSFSKVDNATFNRQVSTDVISRLKGIAPSILFDERSGSPKLTIRGQATIFGNDQPLIVVDNFPYEGDINNINPNDIEDIDILKDAAAASIWGVRAGNGVIVIKTKKGRSDQPMNIGFTSNVTIGQKPDLNYIPQIKPTDFIDIEKMLFEKGFYNTIISNTASNSPYSPVVSILNDQKNGLLTEQQANAQIDALRSGDLRRDMSKYLYQQNLKQQYALNLNGGTNKYSYYFSAGFDKNQNSEKGSGFSRVSVNSNQVFRPMEKLEITAGLSYNQNNQSASNVLSMLNNMGNELMYPYARLVDDSGNPTVVIKDHSTVLKQKALSEGLLNWDFVPLEELELQDNKLKQSEIRLNTAIKYTIMPTLSAEARFQYENQQGRRRNFHSQDSYEMRDQINRFTTINNGVMARNIPMGGRLDISNGELSALNGRFQLNFDQKWGKHQVNAIGGFEVRETKANSISSRQYGFDPHVGSSVLVDYLTRFNQYGKGSSSLIPNYDDYSGTIDRMRSYYLNGAYNYDLRYVVSASARIDQSNLFGVKTNQKSVPLWSTGFKWNLNKESFYNLDWLRELSLRSTFGYSGNIDRSTTAYTTARLTRNIDNSLPSADLVSPPNNELRWERNRMFNIGIDFATQNNRLSGNVEFFKRRGNDLIGNGDIDPTTGFSSFRGNLANMDGRGIDVELTSINLQNKNFSWKTTAIFSYAKDVVTKYKRPTTITNFLTDYSVGRVATAYSPVEGRSLFGIYSYPWAGLDPQTGQARGYLEGQPSAEYTKIRQQLAVDPANNLIYNGNALAPYFGALRNSFSYKGIDLSFNITYRFGYYFRRNSINYSALYSSYYGHGDYYNRWQAPGDELKTNVPVVSYPAVLVADQYYLNSEVLVSKGDHIRLQDVNLSYNLHPDILRCLHIKNVRIFGYINNVCMIWKANKVNLDPDFPMAKPIRTIAFGISGNL